MFAQCAVSFNGEALLIGAPLRQLMQSREEKFEQRFTETFGQVSGDDLPAGIPSLHTSLHGAFKSKRERGKERGGGVELFTTLCLHTSNIELLTIHNSVLNANQSLKHTLAHGNVKGTKMLVCWQLNWAFETVFRTSILIMYWPLLIGQTYTMY